MQHIWLGVENGGFYLTILLEYKLLKKNTAKGAVDLYLLLSVQFGKVVNDKPYISQKYFWFFVVVVVIAVGYSLHQSNSAYQFFSQYLITSEFLRFCVTLEIFTVALFSLFLFYSILLFFLTKTSEVRARGAFHFCYGYCMISLSRLSIILRTEDFLLVLSTC